MRTPFRKEALRFIVLLGIVSLFSDVTYEGARSIIGPYLSLLGASGAAVGTIIGLGELIGYGIRALSGYVSDRTGYYWGMTLVGYALNLAAVPLLAFAGSWQMAGALIFLERLGKAIRTPARDAMLSYASMQTGRGWGFGLHEALDQIGACIGPLLLSLLFFYHASYAFAFRSLAIPAVLALLSLLVARLLFPRPQEMEVTRAPLVIRGFQKSYWIYLLAVGLVAVGYTDFALIAFHFQKTGAIPSTWIPLFYALAMGVDGIAALIMGRLFDRWGVSLLALVTALSSLFSPLVFFESFTGALIGMILWGIGMGAQESIFRAMVATLAPPERRGSAFGLMNLIYGLFWGVGSALMGFLYDLSSVYLVIFSVLIQLISVPLFLLIRR